MSDNTQPVCPSESSSTSDVPVNLEAVSRRVAVQQGVSAVAAATIGLKATAQTQNARSSSVAVPGQLHLIPRDRELGDRVLRFHQLLRTNKVLQSEFINDAGSVVVKQLLSPTQAASLSPQRRSNANRLLYSVMANDRFRDWTQKYQADLVKSGKIDKPQIIRDFSAAIVRFGDANIVQGLVENGILLAQEGGNPRAEGDVAVILLTFIAVIVIVVIAAGIGNSFDKQVFTISEARALTEQLVSRANQLKVNGELGQTFIR